MKVLNSITLKNLKLNKKRTIVTIIGISLSVALICAIATFVSSFQTSMIEREIKTNGNYHIKIQDLSKENEKYLENNAKIQDIQISQEIGYARLEQSQNENKPYAYIEGYDEKLLQNGGIVLTEGRLPENENEIVIPEHLIQNGKADLKVGEKIELDIGNRYKDGYELNQSNPYYTDQDRLDRKESGIEDDLEQETFIANTKKEYTIVGIMERPNSESYSAPGYTMITKLENIDDSKNVNMSIVLKNPSDTYNFEQYLKTDLKISEDDISENEQLLYYLGVFRSNRMENFVVIMAAIVLGIIVFTSAFVIKNSFSISLTEKTRELGMIASIGATSKQIRKSIFFEGAVLGIISIPLGIVIGIVAIGIVLAIVNGIINSGSTPLIDNFELNLSLSGLAILVAVILSVVMIIISLIRPSYRAGKISPIDAIRESSDIKIKKNKNKEYKITKRIFGIEGIIARKNFRRSKKKYRTTIFSIFLSIVLFISMNAFAESVFGLSSLQYNDSRINLIVYENQSKTNEENEEYFNKIKDLEGVKEYAILKNTHAYIDTQKMYTQKAYDQYKDMNALVIYAIGEEAYRNYIAELGLNYDDVKDKAILCDTRIFYEYEEGRDGVKRVEENLFNLKEGDTLEYYNMSDEEGNLSERGTIQIAKRADKYPLGSLFAEHNTNPVIIISDEMMENFEYGIVSIDINAEDPYKLQEEIIELDRTNKDSIYNMEEDVRAAKNMNLIVSIFLYGFIIVISIIGITNIFNTITTNMALRNREFAILKSIGMTNKEFRKMINYESFIYGLKALIFGLPVGVFLSYLIYKVTADVYTTQYEFPVMPVLISIVFVFAIIFITMRYSVKKTKNQNIIETIRKENI